MKHDTKKLLTDAAERLGALPPSDATELAALLLSIVSDLDARLTAAERWSETVSGILE